MSYLNVPRLHFSGSFTAAPSTVNNDPTNYNPNQTITQVAWNPNGNSDVKMISFQDVGSPLSA